MIHLFRSGSAVLCALALGIATPVYAHEGETHEKSATLKHLESLDGEKFEQAFLKSMIHHHDSGVEMAELAQANAKHPEVRALGQKIAKVQQHEIDEMTGWLKAWHKEDAERNFKDEKMDEEMKMTMEKLGAAEGEEFDRLFLKSMIKHHRDGMAMAKLVPEKSKRAELVSAAKKMVSDQTRELEQMATWQESWFAKD